jgi:hypothetical protein
VWLSYCHLTGGFQKHTNLWCDLPDTLELFFSQATGQMKLYCCKDSPCNHFNAHASVKPTEKGAIDRADRGAVYPDALCAMLAAGSTRLLGEVRKQQLPAAFTPDGWNDRCTGCGSTEQQQTCWTCQGCSEIWCDKCLRVRGHARPRPCCKAELRTCSCPPWYCPKH